MKHLLLIFTLLSTAAVAKDYGELVEGYVKMNQEKIELISQQKKRFKGVEIVVADKAQNLASRFGHGMLRLVDDDPYWVNDVVISFSALSYEESYSMRQSLLGGYAIIPEVMNLHEFWGVYTKNEDRDLTRHVINLSPEDLEKFLNTLFHHIRNPELLDRYTFLSNNCIGVITKLFVEAGVTKKKSFAKVPTQVGLWIQENELTLYPAFTMKNFNGVNRRLETLDLNSLSETSILKEFTTVELSYIFLNYAELSEEKSDFLARVLKTRKINLDEAFSFSPIHHSLYTKCDGKVCLDQFASKENESLQESDRINTVIFRLGQKRSYARSYLDGLTYRRNDLFVSESGTEIKSFKLGVRGNRVILSLNVTSNFDQRSRFEQRHLPFVIKGREVFYNEVKVGEISEKNFTFEDSAGLVLVKKNPSAVALITL